MPRVCPRGATRAPVAATCTSITPCSRLIRSTPCLRNDTVWAADAKVISSPVSGSGHPPSASDRAYVDVEPVRKSPEVADLRARAVGEVSVVVPATQADLDTCVARVLLRLLRAVAESDANGSRRPWVA